MRALVSTFTATALAALAVVASAPAAVRQPAPTAAEFGHDVVATANAYAAAHGHTARLRHPDCVEPSPGQYMCSYGIARPGRAVECHIMQARWTPNSASTYTVTLAGRAARCETLRAAIGSLD